MVSDQRLRRAVRPAIRVVPLKTTNCGLGDEWKPHSGPTKFSLPLCPSDVDPRSIYLYWVGKTTLARSPCSTSAWTRSNGSDVASTPTMVTIHPFPWATPTTTYSAAVPSPRT